MCVTLNIRLYEHQGYMHTHHIANICAKSTVFIIYMCVCGCVGLYDVM